MSLQIVISPRVRFKVEGTLATETGNDAPFDFFLVLDRLATEDDVRAFSADVEARQAAGSKYPVSDALIARARSWEGPVDANNQPVPFGDEALRNVLMLPNMTMLVYAAFLRETGAKAKNS